MLRLFIVGSVVAFLLIILMVEIGRREDQRLVMAAQQDRARRIELGAALYDQHCRTCHGVNGEGLGALGPALNDAHFFTTRQHEVGWTGSLHDYVVATIATGRVTATRPLYVGDGVVVMPPWAQVYGGPLRNDQIEALAAFVLNWKATALGEVILSPLPTPTPQAVGDDAQIARGRQVYVAAGCAACHGDDAGGVAEAGPSLLGIGALAARRAPSVDAIEYLRASVLMPAAWIVEGYAKPGDCQAVVSEAQLADLIAYLLTVK